MCLYSPNPSIKPATLPRSVLRFVKLSLKTLCQPWHFQPCQWLLNPRLANIQIMGKTGPIPWRWRSACNEEAAQAAGICGHTPGWWPSLRPGLQWSRQAVNITQEHECTHRPTLNVLFYMGRCRNMHNINSYFKNRKLKHSLRQDQTG